MENVVLEETSEEPSGGGDGPSSTQSVHAGAGLEVQLGPGLLQGPFPPVTNAAIWGAQCYLIP